METVPCQLHIQPFTPETDAFVLVGLWLLSISWSLPTSIQGMAG